MLQNCYALVTVCLEIWELLSLTSLDSFVIIILNTKCSTLGNLDVKFMEN